ncbi:uncharacterized protein LOC116843464 isoform X2 [Odontomachus brunneus]|uniref:uncharacterized protein LOC116843464 isoform X2 n=1 Tax=Odontomachus brunneus TaxID=486640 RepID=UPI0013F1FB85|nr:uncharacterized protein LOC116843464 isoform X2 [Odontomachus brunneus]
MEIINMENLFMQIIIFYGVLHTIVTLLTLFIRFICGNSVKIRVILLELLASTELSIKLIQLTKFTSLFYISITLALLIFLRLYWVDIELSPNIMLEHMLINKDIRFYGVLLIFAQILGDYLAFTFLPGIWSYFGLKRSLSCFSMFYKTDVAAAFAMEWLLTIVYRLSVYSLANMSEELSKNWLTFILSTLLTFSRIAGFYLVGSFNNPALGASLRFYCSGIDYHSLLVYWAAPFCGSLCALFLLRLCKQLAYYRTTGPGPDTRFYLRFEDINYERSRHNNSLYIQQRFEHARSWPINVPFRPR